MFSGLSPNTSDSQFDDIFDDDDEGGQHQLIGRPLSMKMIAKFGWKTSSPSLSARPSTSNQLHRRVYSAQQTAIRGRHHPSSAYHRHHHALRNHIGQVDSQAAMQARLRQQHLQHKGKLPKKIVCNCGRTFSYVGGYTYHLRWECGKVLSCRLCGKVFKDKAYLTKHSRTCTGMEEPPPPPSPQRRSWEMR